MTALYSLLAGCVLVLAFSLTSALYSSGSVFKKVSSNRAALSMSEGTSVVKLPVVQLVRDNVIMGEFVMGSNLERSVGMLQATMEAEVNVKP